LKCNVRLLGFERDGRWWGKTGREVFWEARAFVEAISGYRWVLYVGKKAIVSLLGDTLRQRRGQGS